MMYVQTLLIGLTTIAGMSFAAYRVLAMRTAKRHAEAQVALHSEKHQYRQIDATDFPHLDIEYYDMARDWLTRRGFAAIADIEDFNVTHRQPGMRTFIRVLAGDGGATTAHVYQISPRNVIAHFLQLMIREPVAGRVMEFSTELEDGTHIITSNAEGIDTGPVPTGFVKSIRPQSTKFEELLDEHREAVSNTLIGRNTRTLARVNYDAIINSLHRAQEKKNDSFAKALDGAEAGADKRLGELSRKMAVSATVEKKSSGIASMGKALADELEPDSDTADTDAQEARPVPREIPEGEAQLEDMGDDHGDMETRWEHFCTALKRAIDGTGVDYVMLVAVPKHGSEIGIGRMRGEKPYLCFKRPDESGGLENFKPFYLEGASYDPPFSRIDAIVVGLDHNRVLYVLLEFLEEKEGEERFALSFDPDWDQPTILYLGVDLDAGTPQPYDVRQNL